MSLLNHGAIARLFQKADKLVEAWNLADHCNIRWHGRIVKALDQDTFEGLIAVASLSAVNSDDVHEDARDILMRVDEFAAQLERYDSEITAGSATVRPSGTPEMWSAWAHIRAALEKYEPPQLEPVRILVERDNVPAWQVCKIYGWGSEAKGYQIDKVQEEINEPGKHSLNDPNWTNPNQQRYNDRIAEAWKSRKSVKTFADLKEDRPQTAKPGHAPETLQTLITQRVPIEQIMEMKGVSREDVEHEAARLGVTLVGARFVRPQDAAERAAKQSENEQRQQAEFQAKETKRQRNAAAKRVKELAKENRPSEEIASIMGEEFPAVDVSALLPEAV